MKNLQNIRKDNNINTKCIVCNNADHQIIWNDRIRVSSTRFSNAKEKIIKCLFCNLVSLKKKNKHLEDSSISRNIFNKNNSIKEFFNFPKFLKLKPHYFTDRTNKFICHFFNFFVESNYKFLFKIKT